MGWNRAIWCEVEERADIFRDAFVTVRDIVGGRAGACEKVLNDARRVAIGEMKNEAESREANAVIGVDLDYEVLGKGVNASGVGERYGVGGVRDKAGVRLTF